MPSASPPRKSRPNGKASRPPVPRQDWFSAFAHAASSMVGRPAAFLSALALVVVWFASGAIFGFGETWHLVINSTTSIITFLMVFLIQSTQNRDTLALQVKLAELILHMPGVPKELADAEDMSERQLERLHEHYKTRTRKGVRKAGRGRRKR